MTDTLRAGSVFEMDGDIWIIRSFKNLKVVNARSLTTNAVKEIKLVKIDAPLPTVGGQAPTIENFLNADGEKTDAWREIERISAGLSEVTNAPGRTTSDVKTAAKKLDFSLAKTYRLIRELEKTGRLTSLTRKKRNDIGKTRLDKKIEHAVALVIEKHWLTNQKKTVAAVYEELLRYCRAHKLSPPNRDTLERRIKALPRFESTESREGTSAALPHRLGKGSLQGADYPYAVIQIDHTRVDLELVDSVERKPIGKPWITVAIDVYSRMCVGWYVSFDPPGALATGLTIANLILPKDQQMAEIGVHYEWLCQGIPGIILCDNAGEFRGKMLEMACQNLRFELRFRKVNQPQYGAYIERYQGTLMKWIHALPGTTKSNVKERGSNSTKPVVTLEEFEKLLANLILGKYHYKGHSGLGKRAPVDYYRDAIFGTDEVPPIGISPTPADPERLRLDLLPAEMRTIQPDGVEIDKISYMDDVLKRWLGARDEKHPTMSRKFIFRRDPRNIGKIFFFDPKLNIYLKIPYADRRRRSISLWRLRAVRAWLKVQGTAEKDINEEVIFKALDAIDDIVAAAVKKGKATKKMLLNKEREIKHAKSPAASYPATARTSASPVEDESDEDPSSFLID